MSVVFSFAVLKRRDKFSTATIDRINRLKLEELEAYGIIQPVRVSGYICPICGFGDGSHGNGMEHNKKMEMHTSFVNAVDRKKNSLKGFFANVSKTLKRGDDMKKKAKEKQITITKPEDFLDLILIYFPREYASGYEKAKHSINVMEQESKKIKPYSVEEICYWLNLASFADMAIQDIQTHGVVEN